MNAVKGFTTTIPVHDFQITVCCYEPVGGATDPVPKILSTSFGCNHRLPTTPWNGRSLVGRLCERGARVWTYNFRDQHEAGRPAPRLVNGSSHATLGDLAAMELAAVVDHAVAAAGAAAPTVDLVGLSLGGAIATGYAALVAPLRVRRMVCVGAPLCWNAVPFWATLLTRFPAVAGAIPTGQLHRLVRPLAAQAHRAPEFLLPDWMQDMQAADHVRLGEALGPFSPILNRAVAHWVYDRGVVVNGLRVWDHLGAIRSPTLCVTGSDDQFASPRNVQPALMRFGTAARERHVVEIPHATHTELFVGRRAARDVYPRVVDFVCE